MQQHIYATASGMLKSKKLGHWPTHDTVPVWWITGSSLAKYMFQYAGVSTSTSTIVCLHGGGALTPPLKPFCNKLCNNCLVGSWVHYS